MDKQHWHCKHCGVALKEIYREKHKENSFYAVLICESCGRLYLAKGGIFGSLKEMDVIRETEVKKRWW